ncbi:hypothetical protein Tco_1435019, partial [Tanacetum coccineum]
YEALEASMERENKDEFLAVKDKSRKRRCDNQATSHPSLAGSKNGLERRSLAKQT